MNIKKIVLKTSGFKGAHVTYLREEQKNGKPYINEVTEKRKHPIHLSLETMFKDLRYHLLDITNVLKGDEEKMEKDFIILESEVTGIEFSGEHFVLMGEKRVFADKVIKLKTCKVTPDDEYEHYDSVMALINSIVEETKEYLAGTKKVDDVEVAVRWVEAGKHKSLDMETLKGYSPEQLKKFASELLESGFGAVVMFSEDYEASEGKLNEIVEKELGEIELDAEEVVIPLPIKKEPIALSASNDQPAF
jgi:hypothetical protein